MSLREKTVRKVRLRLASANLIPLLLNFSVNRLFSTRVILKNSLKINRVKLYISVIRICWSKLWGESLWKRTRVSVNATDFPLGRYIIFRVARRHCLTSLNLNIVTALPISISLAVIRDSRRDNTGDNPRCGRRVTVEWKKDNRV